MRAYSVLKATTGSFFAALLAGISPEMRVRPTLRTTSITACENLRLAIPEKLISGLSIIFAIADIR